MNNKPPVLVYLAYKYSGNPTLNTAEARKMGIALMKKHSNWFVLVPHYACDAMLDGTINWKRSPSNFTEWRRTQAGKMSFAFLAHATILVMGCKPVYEESSGVTWEHIFAEVLNVSYRKDDPIKIMSYQEAMEYEDK